jgi:hypothetical protein
VIKKRMTDVVDTIQLNGVKKGVMLTAVEKSRAHTKTSKDSKHAAKPPSQVTVDKNSNAIYIEQLETKEKASKHPSQVTFRDEGSPVTFSDEGIAAPLHQYAAPRRARGASSEVK